MSPAYTTAGWAELFLATAGAAAALCTVIFAGLSVNIEVLLAIDEGDGQHFLTGRALEALVALLNVLAISVVALTPTIPRAALPAVVLLIAGESAISPVRALAARRSEAGPRRAVALRLITGSALTFVLLVGGVSLAAGYGGGLYWLPAGFLLAITVSAINTWVLLSEVLRSMSLPPQVSAFAAVASGGREGSFPGAASGRVNSRSADVKLPAECGGSAEPVTISNLAPRAVCD